jgi:pyrroline-5-carboxylate reductase
VAETMSKLAADSGLSISDKDLASVMFTAWELLQENESAGFAEVQNKVASKKGVTEEALNTMKSAGINEIISQAINNAIERSKKLND